jgi:hypothetical protein
LSASILVEVNCNMDLICAGVIVGYTDIISAAAHETIGAA